MAKTPAPTELHFIRAEGARELRKALRRAGREDLRQAVKAAHIEIAEIVAEEAKRRAPVGKTGDLQKAIKGRGTLAEARVNYGKKTVPYAAPIHWGWPKRNIEPALYVSDAVEDKMPEVRKIFDSRMADITKAFNEGPSIT